MINLGNRTEEIFTVAKANGWGIFVPQLTKEQSAAFKLREKIVYRSAGTHIPSIPGECPPVFFFRLVNFFPQIIKIRGYFSKKKNNDGEVFVEGHEGMWEHRVGTPTYTVPKHYEKDGVSAPYSHPDNYDYYEHKEEAWREKHENEGYELIEERTYKSVNEMNLIDEDRFITLCKAFSRDYEQELRDDFTERYDEVYDLEDPAFRRELTDFQWRKDEDREQFWSEQWSVNREVISQKHHKESDYEDYAIILAEKCGKNISVYRADTSLSTKGCPDICIHDNRGRTHLAELKTENGELSLEQKDLFEVTDSIHGLLGIHIFRLPKDWDKVAEILMNFELDDKTTQEEPVPLPAKSRISPPRRPSQPLPPTIVTPRHR